jgi:2-iminobutanoate/2-iminopropanoate deaminase
MAPAPTAFWPAGRAPPNGQHPPMYSNPPALFDPTGPWSLIADAGPTLYLAGLRGIDPATNRLVEGPMERVRQIFTNLRLATASVGLGLDSVVRLTVFVTDMKEHRPLVNKAQEEVWGAGPYPPRTIVQVGALNQDDIVEVEATLHRRA